jgi:hypothetical protein
MVEAPELAAAQAMIEAECGRLIAEAGWSIAGIARHLRSLGSEARDGVPAEIFREIRRLLETGRHTISAILSHIRALDAPTTKAGIKALPPALREELDRLFRDDRCTIDQIVAHLRGLGAEVSRSAVGRLKQKWDARLARYREAQEVAGVWVKKLEEEPGGDVGRLLQEMLKSLAYQTMSQMDPGGDGAEGEDGGAVTPVKDLSFLARMIKDMESARRLSIDTELRIKRAFKAKVDATLADAEAKADGKPDLLAALKEIRENVYGIAG